MVKKILTTVLMAIYKVLAIVNLQPAIFVVIVGLIVFLTGSFITYPVLKTVFLIALGLSVLYAVIITFCKLFGFGTKKNNSKIQIVNEKTKQPEEKTQTPPPAPKTPQPVPETTKEPTYPIYSRVKNHPNLLMAEFSDRYELYKKENGKLIRLRQDYKGR
ncbi:MAG: hypothetical protein IKW33_02940 [Clostridia bacterium]|nr:hypothetical protein [Clostridia bacterium]